MKQRPEWFDEIGIAYARNYAAMEAARNHFVNCREAILGDLAGKVDEALRLAQIVPDGPHEGEDGWRCRWLPGTYQRARSEGGTKTGRVSAVAWAIERHPDPTALGDHDGEPVGFFTYVLFTAPDALYRRLRGVVEGISRELGVPSVFWLEAKEIVFIGGWIAVDDARFTLDNFEQEVAKLPGLFTQIDGLLGAACARLNE